MKKKKSAKKQGLPFGLLIGGGIAIGVVLIVAVSASAYFILREKPNHDAAPEKIAQNKDKKDEKQQPPPPDRVKIVPGIKEGNPATKPGGDGIINNVRGAGYRTERRSELRQIGIAFVSFCDSFKGPNRTMDNFLEEIKTFGPIRDSVKDGYYTVNINANPNVTPCIIAYETAVDQGRHMCVMWDGSVDFQPVDVVKKATGK